jgi:monoterpene epsilon-lactone hydrolase
VEVVAPEYRLAPEYPFPAGLRDAFSCLQALSESAQDDVPLIVSGDSAGAGLAASLAVLVSASGSPRVDGLVLLSPWLDLTVSAASYAHNSATDTLFSKESAEGAAELYLQGLDRMHPLASPLHAAFSAYPPTFISVGRGEVLLDDGVRFHAKLQAQGFSSTLQVVDGMQHVAVVRGMDLPGSAETFARLTGFLEQVISKPR